MYKVTCSGDFINIKITYVESKIDFGADSYFVQVS